MKTTFSLLVIASLTTFFWVGSHGQAAPPGGPATDQPNAYGAADQVIALERRAWETAQSGDKRGYGDLLADDFVLINEGGVSNKDQNLKVLDDLRILDYQLQDVNPRRIAPDVLLLVYKVKVKLSFQGHISSGNSYRSSLWAKRDGKWLNVSYQASDER